VAGGLRNRRSSARSSALSSLLQGLLNAIVLQNKGKLYMQLPSVSCVLLAYNEEKIIEKTIQNALLAMDRFAVESEVIVVGFEGCSDRTNELVVAFAQHSPRVRLVLQPKTSPGYGKALWIGLCAAKNEWIFQSDSDGQYDFNELEKLLPITKESGVGLVHGYREKRNDPFERVIMAGIYNFALRRLFGIRLRDVDSAFKLILRDALKGVSLDSSSGFGIMELLLKIRRKGYQFRQLPVRHLARVEGEALADKGQKNPFGFQLPNFKLVKGTLTEMWHMYRVDRNSKPERVK